VVNSATEQIEEQKRNMATNVNNTINMREANIKTDLYSDLSKKVERYRHLPKLKMNNREHAALYEPSYQSIDYGSIEEEPPIANVTIYQLRPAKLWKIDSDSFPSTLDLRCKITFWLPTVEAS